jgi:lipopolysaccharide biosynthesis protein
MTGNPTNRKTTIKDQAMMEDITKRPTEASRAASDVDALRTALMSMLAAAPRALRVIVAQDLAEAETTAPSAEASAALRLEIEALG